MEPQATTRHGMETTLIEKCWKDPEFKKAVVSDPKGMLERHTGQKLPAQVNIFIHEEGANTLHLSIPVTPNNVAELSDEDLEKVAGGTEIVSLVITGVSAALTVAGTIGRAVSSGW
jgi:hypothetical protein